VSKITQEVLRKHFFYDKETGIFYWKEKPEFSFRQVGDPAGSHKIDGYFKLTINKQEILAHRAAFLYMTGILPVQVDHINHNKLDNRWCNLRAATSKLNNMNRSKATNNTSGCTGVNWNKAAAKWVAKIYAKGKRIHLGYHNKLEDAIAARQKANRDYGFHQNHGAV